MSVRRSLVIVAVAAACAAGIAILRLHRSPSAVVTHHGASPSPYVATGLEESQKCLPHGPSTVASNPATPAAGHRRTVREALTALYDHYKKYERLRESHEHTKPCEFCEEYLRSGLKVYNGLIEEYCRTAFADPASMLALLELVRDEPDQEFREFAARQFNWALLDEKDDPAMVNVLLPFLGADVNLQSIVINGLHRLRGTRFTDAQLGQIMAFVTENRSWPSWGSPLLIDVFKPYFYGNEDVHRFVVNLALDPGAYGSGEAVILLTQFPRDEEAYRIVAGYLERDDLSVRRQLLALYALGRQTGADLTPANPSAVDYVGKLGDLYGRTGSQEIREKIGERIVEFDIPEAAELAGRFLSDSGVELRSKTWALEMIAHYADANREKLYPSSKDAWLNTLETVAGDQNGMPEIRVKARLAWLSVVYAQGLPPSAVTSETLRAIDQFENDPNPELRNAGTQLRQLARKYGILTAEKK